MRYIGANKRQLRRSSAYKLIAALCFTAVALVAAIEVGMQARLITPTFRSGDYEIALDRERIFRFVPNDADINSLGYRDHEYDRLDNDRAHIVVLGDSFTMGLNVRRENTFSGMLDAMLEPEHVLNMGVQGYGPDQSLLVLKNDALRLNPSTVVLALYPSNDFNDIYKNGIFTLDDEGGLSLSDENLLTQHMSSLRFLYLLDYLRFRLTGNPGYFMHVFAGMFDDDALPDLWDDSDEKEAYMRALLREYRDILYRENKRFIVLMIPSFKELAYSDGVPENDAIVERICAEEGIEAVNMYRHFNVREDVSSFYDLDDLHLSREGNEAVAMALSAAISGDN